jgi:AcrR family transcriptional regulator
MEIMSAKSYKNITVSEACMKAGVSRMGFYRHYGDLDEVPALHLEERFESFLARVNHMGLSDTDNPSLLLFQDIIKSSISTD